MLAELVREPRPAAHGRTPLSWRDRDGNVRSVEIPGIDFDGSDYPEQIALGDAVFTRARQFQTLVGPDFDDRRPEPAGSEAPVDHYEVLQVSPGTETETIRRVYRIMAARFHPDNPDTGDVEKFLLLGEAHRILSDPKLRADYDRLRESRNDEPDPIFGLRDFVVGIEGEMNRRLGVLSLLYNQRRKDPDHPSVSILDLERRMSFPREHLQFTVWYLRSKDYVAAGDSGNYTLTAAGADYVESNLATNSLLQTLVDRTGSPAPDFRHGERRGNPAARPSQWSVPGPQRLATAG